MKIKVAFIKNPINGCIFVETKQGTGLGWGSNEKEAKAHALEQVRDDIELEFVTPTELYL